MEENKLPTHIGIIMDGNRRWAKQRNLPVKLGHKQGADTLENIVRHANNMGLKYLTVYAFSTENWKRSEDEVNALMLLLKNYLDDFAKRADTENIVIRVLGDRTPFSKKLNESIDKTIKRTEPNTGIIFNICLNYGGRDELVHATKRIASMVQSGEIKVDDINEELISNNLYTKDIPDPDLIIRTSGELRTSGFLTWQSVYSEFLFLDKYWPDFSEEDFDNAIKEFNNRKRRIGK